MHMIKRVSILIILSFFPFSLFALAPKSYHDRTISQNCAGIENFNPWREDSLWIDFIVGQKGMFIPAGIVSLDDFLSDKGSFTVDLQKVFKEFTTQYSQYVKAMGWLEIREIGITDESHIIFPIIAGFIRFIEKQPGRRPLNEILKKYSYSYNPDTHFFTFNYPPQNLVVEDFKIAVPDEDETYVASIDSTPHPQLLSMPPVPIEGKLELTAAIIRDIMRILEEVGPKRGLTGKNLNTAIHAALIHTPFSYVRMIRSGGQKDILILKRKSALGEKSLPQKFQQTEFFVVHVPKVAGQENLTTLENLTALKVDPDCQIARLPVDSSLEPRFRNICVTRFLGLPLDAVVTQAYPDTPPNPYHLSYLLLECLLKLRPVHAKGIVHRDLKPDNILIDNKGNVSLIDMGVCSDILKFIGSVDSFYLSPSYAPPECYMLSPDNNPLAAFLRNFSQKVDIFSLGIIFYNFLVGEEALGDFSTDRFMEFVLSLPERVGKLHRESAVKMALKTMDVQYDWVVKNEQEIFGLIKRMLSPEQEKRPTTEDAIREILAMTEIPAIAKCFLEAEAADYGKYRALDDAMKKQLESEMTEVLSVNVPWFHLISKKGLIFKDPEGKELDFSKTMEAIQKNWTHQKTLQQILKEKIDDLFSVQVQKKIPTVYSLIRKPDDAA